MYNCFKYSCQSRRNSNKSGKSRPKENPSTAEDDDITDERLKGIDPKMVELINNEVCKLLLVRKQKFLRHFIFF